MTDTVVVPKEPTYEMVQAGAKVVKDNLPYHTGTLEIYKAMLSASPAPTLAQPACDPAKNFMVGASNVVYKRRSTDASLAQPVGGENYRLNVRHPDCHKAADAFWKYWRENGETHKHGYYESTWGAINAALKLVGVVLREPAQVQACRPEDRAILETPAGQEMIRAAINEMNDKPTPLVDIPSRSEAPRLPVHGAVTQEMIDAGCALASPDAIQYAPALRSALNKVYIAMRRLEAPAAPAPVVGELVELPELPPAFALYVGTRSEPNGTKEMFGYIYLDDGGQKQHLYTQAQMRAYAAAALERLAGEGK